MHGFRWSAPIALALLGIAGGVRAEPVWTAIASDQTAELASLNAAAGPALDDEGAVVFTGSAAVPFASALLFRVDVSGARQQLVVSSQGLKDIVALRATSRGEVLLAAKRNTPEGLKRGLYQADVARGSLGALFEVRDGAGDLPQAQANAAGQLAFVLQRGMEVEGCSLEPGVYVLDARGLTPVARASDGFLAFQDVELGAAGQVVFLATRSDGVPGVFAGPHHAVVVRGDSLHEDAVDELVLGQLNAHGALALITRDATRGRSTVWRVDEISFPEPAAPLCAG